MAKKDKVGKFTLRSDKEAGKLLEEVTHLYHGGARCMTETVGHATPQNRSPLELVVNASQGFIPLWDRGVTLNWRFHERALLRFMEPDAVAADVRELVGEAILAWSPAVPVRFVETNQPWDFEIVVSVEDDCDAAGCTLARAFFPDAGQHDLVLRPRLFQESRKEQVETLVHELGHIFGLRHFFAKTREAAFPSEIFGEHDRFSIMNYGPDSVLTETDISDLARLYTEAWSGHLSHINGTPIRLVQPFSAFQTPAPAMVAQAAYCDPAA